MLKSNGVIFLLSLLLFSDSRWLSTSSNFIGSNIRAIITVLRDVETQWMVTLCLTVYFILFLILEKKHSENSQKIVWFASPHFWLSVFIVFALAYYVFGYNGESLDTQILVLLTSIVFGKVANFILTSGKLKPENGNDMRIINLKSRIINFLMGLVVLLTFSSWWHSGASNNYYPAGIRWTGLWDNPDVYGMLMGVGGILAAGMLATSSIFKIQNSKLIGILVIAVFMMGVGLFFSYSRGAWLGTVVGLLYLAKQIKVESGKWKAGTVIWYFLPLVVLTTAVVCFFWHTTSNDAPWYIKRMDLSRPSAQHRVAAWRASLEIIHDHPLGIGWGRTIEIYEKNYSPPEKGAGAITTNDYLMLGAQLGIPALVCFLVYVALQLGVGRWQMANGGIENPEFRIKVACRAAVVAMLVEFWFDGGLFKLATASVFWTLLELGSNCHQRKILSPHSS